VRKGMCDKHLLFSVVGSVHVRSPLFPVQNIVFGKCNLYANPPYKTTPTVASTLAPISATQAFAHIRTCQQELVCTQTVFASRSVHILVHVEPTSIEHQCLQLCQCGSLQHPEEMLSESMSLAYPSSTPRDGGMILDFPCCWGCHVGSPALARPISA